jgi:hypothetical protein
MRTAELEAEHRIAVRNLETEDAVELCNELDISFFLVAIHQMVGIMPIRLSGRFWEPDPESQYLAYVTPVRIDRPDTVLTSEPWGTPRMGELVDLIAWHPEVPGRWFLRTGAVAWLGAVPYGEPFPARIFASVLSWLQADCDGLVLTTSDPDELRAIVSELPQGIRTETPGLAALLEGAIRQKPTVPLITPWQRE